MRNLSTTAILIAALATGCSNANSSTDASASPSPQPKGTTDARTGLPVYPGALQSSTSDSSAGKMTSFMSDDSEQTVGNWYKATLPATYVETDHSSDSSDPTISFDTSAAKIYLSTVGSKTSISVEKVNP